MARSGEEGEEAGAAVHAEEKGGGQVEVYLESTSGAK